MDSEVVFGCFLCVGVGFRWEVVWVIWNLFMQRWASKRMPLLGMAFKLTLAWSAVLCENPRSVNDG